MKIFFFTHLHTVAPPILSRRGQWATFISKLKTLSYSFPSFFFFDLFYLIYLWLCWVFVSVRGLSLVVASGGHSSSRCAGLSLSRPLLLQSTGSRRAGSVVVAHGPSCSAACGIFPDQGSNPCPLHWQADFQPLRHQGSPFLPPLTLTLTTGKSPLSSSNIYYGENSMLQKCLVAHNNKI